MADLPKVFEQALGLHRAGHLQEAMSLYDSILRQVPAHAETLYLRGVASLQAKDFARAKNDLSAAVRTQPSRAPYWISLGQAYLESGPLDQARAAFEKALALDPRSPEAHTGIADASLRMRLLPEAVHHYRQSLSLVPQQLTAWINLSQAYLWKEEPDLAWQAANKAMEIDPRSKEARFNRAVAARLLGRDDAARDDYQAILADHPSFVPAVINLANLQAALGEWEQAIQRYDEGLRQEPKSVSLRFARGALRHEHSDWSGALADYDAVLAIDPHHQAARENRTAVLRQVGRWEEAVESLRQRTATNPSDGRAWLQLGNALLDRDESLAARECFEQIHILTPTDWTARLRIERVCPLLFDSEEEMADYRTKLETSLRQLLTDRRSVSDIDAVLPGLEPSFHWPFHGMNDRVVKELYSQLFEEITWPVRRKETCSQGRPRVGIVVTDSHEPVFLRSMGGIIQRLKRTEYDLTMVTSPQGRSRLAPALGLEGVQFVTLPNRLSVAIPLLARLHFDLLFFWEVGTDSHNYFLPMARLARQQAVSWGVPVTTGQRAVDDYLSSQWLEPAGAEAHYTERLVLLNGLLSFQEPRRAEAPVPARESFGLSREDHVYVCSQNIGKLHPRFVELLAEIMERDPLGRLVLTGSRHPGPNRQLERILSDRFRSNRARVNLIEPLSTHRYHDLLRVADVQLDPFPFCGANSSYDAFSFGLPVVTREGVYQRGRFTSACYRAMGLPERISMTDEEYVERAVSLGTDADLRRYAAQEITERSHLLFCDPETPREWEEYVLRAISSPS